MSTDSDLYKSQYSQDKFIDEYLKRKENGVFLDVGAHDGVFLSNSYFFEKARHWRGLCVEPNPRLYKDLVRNRDCDCLDGAVSDKEGMFDFLDLEGVEALGGLVDKYDPLHMQRVNRDFEKYQGKSRRIIQVRCYDINKVLEDKEMFRIDYCSIDTEGGELEILKSLDLDRFFVASFTIENNYPSSGFFKRIINRMRGASIEGYLSKKGYRLIERLGCDEVYVHNSIIN
jgi:FkbM family methyltransferase